jgi:hypothetical protein
MHSLRLRILFGGKGLLARRGFSAMRLQRRGERSQGLWRAQRMRIFCRMGSGGGGSRLSAALSVWEGRSRGELLDVPLGTE